MDAGVPSPFDRLVVYEIPTPPMVVVREVVDASLIISVWNGERHSGILPTSLTTNLAVTHAYKGLKSYYPTTNLIALD